ncbi:phage tail protein [Pectobacterium cacticida]|uniref:phage tail-collar fiber domain-containing protein n=1 Tax=Pectobacterium cacticida TaxID=69221 RepID=UPI002FEEED7D
MSAKYFVLLTHIGAAKLANATVLGSHLEITHMAVGDGGGTLPTPNPAQTALINEKRRAGINTLSVDPANTNQIIAEQVIPENEGGFWIREIGLFDADGDLIAVGNCAETYKPLLQEGSGRIQTVRMILIVSSTDAVQLKIDPAVVLATRGYVDDALAAHEKSRTHPDGTLTAKGFVQLSNATNSANETLAATPKAVKAAMDNANGRVPSGRKVNGKALTADIALTAGDVGAYTKAETDTKVSAANTAAANAATAAANANTNANGRVPSGRKVNGKALTADIALTAGDVGAYTKAETDTKISAANTAAANAATAAANANTNANGRVPSGRMINGKALTADIALTAGDVGALPVSGTAVAATKLAAARTINGVAFDGTANITLPWDFPAGAPIPYPLSTPPTGWIKCNGQPFNKATYPKLASAYPSGVLPDLRGEFIRGWDDGRGADAGRKLLSQQGDAIRNITGEFQVVDLQNYLPSGAFLHSTRTGAGLSGDFVGVYHSNVKFDASRVVPTAPENRPRNIAFNYIVRAA